MPTKFVAAPGPSLNELGLEPHHWKRGAAGPRSCAYCPLPRQNRVHDETQVDGRSPERAEWAALDAARLGERDF
jgi:hypothetical protein